ncbi:MAG: DUF2855 family protein, partial [Candidatus Hydrogenedentes bacterium]|nr:DUF2855 family protein [Candidatus Hydrogenedentota bacterium]
VAGDMLSYWNFFPAQEGWGRIPIWGIGVVAESNHEGMQVGDRYYGYFPMSTWLVVQPEKVTTQGFVDASAHRQALPPTYNQYSRMTPELGFDEKYDDYAMLFRPLFMTSFLLDDFLDDNDFFSARTVVLSSASSKTAFGLAYLLSQRGESGPEVIGLTSPRNVDFVEGLGCYDQVLSYCDIATLSNNQPTVFVDMAGNAEVITAVHNRFADQLKYSCLVGITHWQQNAPTSGLPGAEPKFFFAPDQIQKRAKDWGAGGLQERFAKVWSAFMKPVAGWIDVVHGQGKESVEQVYTATLEGRAKPNEGHVLSL